MLNRSVIFNIICFLLILLFVYAAGSKIADYKQFVSDLKNQPFPDSWTVTLSWLVPGVEIGIAVCLFFDRTRAIGLLLSILLMTAFTIYTLLVLVHTFRYVPCSCGGVIRKLSWGQHLVFNLFFLSISIAGYVMEKKYFMHENRPSRKPV